MKTKLSVATIVFLAAACGTEKDVELEQNAMRSLQMLDEMRPFLRKKDVGGGPLAISSSFFHVVLASFGENRGSTCEPPVHFGACRVNANCADQPESPRLSAGPVTMSGGVRTVTLIPNPAARRGYNDVFGRGPIWNGGEEIVFSAPGELGQVPPFELTGKAPYEGTLTAPDVLLDPTWSFFEPITINRAEPIELTWTFGEGCGARVRSRWWPRSLSTIL